MPLWNAKLSARLINGLASTSRSGMVPATAPHNIALLPIFFDKQSSPTEAPSTICVKESTYQSIFSSLMAVAEAVCSAAFLL